MPPFPELPPLPYYLRRLEPWFAALFSQIATLQKGQNQMAATVADVDAALTALEGEEKTIIQDLTDIAAALAAKGNPDLTPEVTRINAVVTALQNAVAANPDPGAPAPPPAGP